MATAEGPKPVDEARLLAVIDDLSAELRPGRRPAPAGLDSRLDQDQGLDSLARVELIARLEEAFEVRLDEAVGVEAETPRDLARAIAAAPARGEAGAKRQPRARAAAAAARDEEFPLPHVARTWLEVLDFQAGARGEAPAIRFFTDEGDGEVLTFAGLARHARSVAAGLIERGVEPGRAVALMLPTSPDYFRSFLGIWAAGAVPVPIYPPFRPSHIAEHVERQAGILANSQAVLLVTTPELATAAKLLRGRVAGLEGIVTPAELEARRPVPEPPTDPEDTGLLQYTSGSTAAPKGVILSHANLLANVRAIGTAVEVGPDDVTVSWLPLYHDMGLIGAWLGSLYHGLPLVLMSPLAFIGRPVRWLEAIHRYRGTLTAAPNFAFDLATRRIRDAELEGLDLSSLRGIYNGAEAISPDTLERFTRRFAAFGFKPEAMIPVYGLAECCVGLTFPPLGRQPVIDAVDRRRLAADGEARMVSPETPGAKRFVGCGSPLSGHELRIVDDADRELPERREGHIQFRGPSATSGYLHNPEATSRLLHGDWLDTGDLGYVAKGDLFITGRAKDIIIKAGRNIYPEELEEAVGALDGIRAGNVAAFGMADETTGEERLVVLAETRKTDPSARQALEQAIEGAAIELTGMPADQVVLAPPNTVLKTSSGKIRRDACRQLVQRGEIGRSRKAVWRQVVNVELMSLGPRLTRLRRRLRADAFAVWSWLFAGLVGLLGVIAIAILPTVAGRWAACRALLRLMARATGTRLDLVGDRKIRGTGQAVLVANHASYLDGFTLIAVLPRPAAFVAKAELGQTPLVGWLLRRLGCVFVERFDRTKSLADLRQMGAATEDGLPLLFFPEGTFDRMPGLLPFQLGAFVVAAEHGLPVVPIAISGTRSILRSESWYPRAGRIEVTIGEPIEPGARAAADAWHRAVALRDRARSFLLEETGEPDLAAVGRVSGLQPPPAA